ncbi:pupal cuticle protein C1B-like [Pararge aegeria]|uniref:Jg13387 protein n=1 Tax=Pararge aegeria aegeria TaxID=348720 RepID=A0A8S4RNK9_9NEOP|nr:pupal cuticle protein C1B-like [Pararge aegeria]CAH2238704.1 jg13387 [Pararge aegeria aegeria]
MIDKIVIVLVCLSYARAEYYSSHSSVPSVGLYGSINNGPGTRRAYPTTPAPIYEDNMDNIQSTYGSQMPLIEVINTPFTSRRSDSTVNIDHHSNRYSSHAIQNQVLFQPAYNPPPVIPGSLSAPVTYTAYTHSTPLVNAYSGPVVATTYGQPSYASHIPIASQAVKTTITYSEAPAVSHVTFASHGPRFTW